MRPPRNYRRRTSVADAVKPLIDAALGADLSIGVRCWDGSTFGADEAPVTLTINNRRALRRILWAPSELGFARAYVSGDLDLTGDLFAGLDALAQVAPPERGPGVTIDKRTKAAILRCALRLKIIGPPPKPPAEEVRVTGRRHSRRRDAAAVGAHYDVSNDFYRIVLGESMTYTSAYWPHTPSTDFTLEQAQLAKCNLTAGKLGLREGMRVLDVGCGWGTFAVHAARTYGVRVVGVTLSHEQADYATQRVIEAGLADRVEIRVQDYRDVHDGPFDAISSIGMAEHVGASLLPTYAADLYALLAPLGRLLNSAISCRPRPPTAPSRTSFIDRYVFPDGELETLASTIDALEGAGFEVRDVEAMREHYALTLREWVAKLERDWGSAVRATSGARARIWRLYMAGSALAFEANRLGVNHVLAVKPDDHGTSAVPPTRAGLAPHGNPASTAPPSGPTAPRR